MATKHIFLCKGSHFRLCAAIVADDGGFGVMSGGPAAGATVTQYAIGPRGTEKITSRDAQTGNTIKALYAMYDAHGNMMSTARRSGLQLLIENNIATHIDKINKEPGTTARNQWLREIAGSVRRIYKNQRMR